MVSVLLRLITASAGNATRDSKCSLAVYYMARSVKIQAGSSQLALVTWSVLLERGTCRADMSLIADIYADS